MEDENRKAQPKDFQPTYVLASTDDPFQKDDQASLLGYVNVLLKRRWLLFLIFLAATGSAYVASRLQPREYEATATFLVSEKSSTEVMGEKGQVFLSLKSPVEYFNKIAISARILDELLQIKFNHPETGSPATLWEIWKIDTESEAEKAYLGREALRSRIELTNEGNSPNIMTLTVTAGSPQLAAPLANSLVKLLGLYDVDLKTQHARERVTFIQAQVKAEGLKDGAYAQAEISRLDVQGNPNVHEKIIHADIQQDFFRSDENNGIPLKANDQVFVRKHPEYAKQPVVEISGEVQFPGRYVLQSGEDTLARLIERSGGLKSTAYSPAASLWRLEEILDEEPQSSVLSPVENLEKEEQPVEETTEAAPEEVPEQKIEYRVIFDLDQALQQPSSDGDLFLRHGDRLEIPRFENVVQVRGEVLTETTIVFSPGKNISYYIDRAGGIGPWAGKKNITITYPDGSVLKHSKFLWFDRKGVEPMSVITVPAWRGSL